MNSAHVVGSVCSHLEVLIHNHRILLVQASKPEEIKRHLVCVPRLHLIIARLHRDLAIGGHAVSSLWAWAVTNDLQTFQEELADQPLVT